MLFESSAGERWCVHVFLPVFYCDFGPNEHLKSQCATPQHSLQLLAAHSMLGHIQDSSNNVQAMVGGAYGHFYKASDGMRSTNCNVAHSPHTFDKARMPNLVVNLSIGFSKPIRCQSLPTATLKQQLAG